MHEMFTTTPTKFKAYCTVINNKKQEELNNKIQARDKYVRDISSKRDEFNRLVDEYSQAYASTTLTVIEKVEMFKNMIPKTPDNMNIFTYYQPTIFLKE